MAKPRARAKSANVLRTPAAVRLTLGIDEAGRGPAVGPKEITARKTDDAKASVKAAIGGLETLTGKAKGKDKGKKKK